MAINYVKQYPGWAVALQEAMKGLQAGHAMKMDRESLALREKGLEQDATQFTSEQAWREKSYNDSLELRKADDKRLEARDAEQSEYRKWQQKQVEDALKRENQTRMADAKYLLDRMGANPGADPASAIRYATQLNWASKLSPDARRDAHKRLDEEEEWGNAAMEIERLTTPQQTQDGQQGPSALTPDQGQQLIGLRAHGATPASVMGAAQSMIRKNAEKQANDAENQNALAIANQLADQLPVGDRRRGWIKTQTALYSAMPWATASERSKSLAEINNVANGFAEVPDVEEEKAKRDYFLEMEFKSLADRAATGDEDSIARFNAFKKAHGLAVYEDPTAVPAEEDSGPGMWESFKGMFSPESMIPAPMVGNQPQAAGQPAQQAPAPLQPQAAQSFASRLKELEAGNPQMSEDEFTAAVQQLAQEMGIDLENMSDADKEALAQLYEGGK